MTLKTLSDNVIPWQRHSSFGNICGNCQGMSQVTVMLREKKDRKDTFPYHLASEDL